MQLLQMERTVVTKLCPQDRCLHIIKMFFPSSIYHLK